MQSIGPFMSTMTWLEFNEQFSRFFCPAFTRKNYRCQLMHLVKGDRSVEDFTHEFLRLRRYALDVMHDEDRAAELFVILVRFNLCYHQTRWQDSAQCY